MFISKLRIPMERVRRPKSGSILRATVATLRKNVTSS